MGIAAAYAWLKQGIHPFLCLGAAAFVLLVVGWHRMDKWVQAERNWLNTGDRDEQDIAYLKMRKEKRRLEQEQ